jgi:hypothetical protein
MSSLHVPTAPCQRWPLIEARARLSSIAAAIPDEVSRLFWDVDPASIDFVRHSDYVIERVATRGGWAAMRWLRERYAIEILGDFIRRRGDRLPPRELAYWSLIAGVDVEPRTGGGRPRWAGP